MVKRSQKEKRQIVRRFIKRTGFNLRGASVEVERLTNQRFSPGSFSTSASRKTHSDKMVNAILQIQKGKIPTKRRLRKASTVNPLGKRREKRERKPGKKRGLELVKKHKWVFDKKTGKRRGVGELGSATSKCKLYEKQTGKTTVLIEGCSLETIELSCNRY